MHARVEAEAHDNVVSDDGLHGRRGGGGGGGSGVRANVVVNVGSRSGGGGGGGRLRGRTGSWNGGQG